MNKSNKFNHINDIIHHGVQNQTFNIIHNNILHPTNIQESIQSILKRYILSNQLSKDHITMCKNFISKYHQDIINSINFHRGKNSIGNYHMFENQSMFYSVYWMHHTRGIFQDLLNQPKNNQWGIMSNKHYQENKLRIMDSQNIQLLPKNNFNSLSHIIHT